MQVLSLSELGLHIKDWPLEYCKKVNICTGNFVGCVTECCFSFSLSSAGFYFIHEIFIDIIKVGS